MIFLNYFISRNGKILIIITISFDGFLIMTISSSEFVQVLCSDGKSKGAKKKKKHRKKDSVDLPATTTTTVVVVEDDCNNRLAVDKRSTSSSALASSAAKLGPPPGHATSSVSPQPKNGIFFTREY